MIGIPNADQRLEEVLAPWSSGGPRGLVRVVALETAAGRMLAGASEKALLFLEFELPGRLEDSVQRWRSLKAGRLAPGENGVLRHLEVELRGYLGGELTEFATPIELIGTPFQKSVWRALTSIPFGETTNYGALAERLGCPGAVRAVANANASNRLAIIVPCHRVIGRSGELAGYAGGLDKKRYLLDLEASATGRPVQAQLF